MKRRSQAREFALQMLYEIDLVGRDPRDCLDSFWDEDGSRAHRVSGDSAVKEFSVKLVSLVAEHRKEIDRVIEQCTEHWRIPRMALVDRNILRIGTCELLYLEGIPTRVVINEAIELAKKFGDEESSKFINGILDRVAKTHRSESE